MTGTLRLVVAWLCVLFLSAAFGVAQNAQNTTGTALTAEHAVPFGTVSGKLLLLGNYLVFVDEQQPNASFVVAKSVIENLKADGLEITVQTREPIRNRSGEVTRLNFRVASGGDPAAVTSWYGSGVPNPGGSTVANGPAPSTGTAANVAGTTKYQVRHSHTFGDCSGTLILGPNQLSFESVSTVSHSRRWEYQAIKETELSNPYELEIKPFTGESYKLRFDGSGMDPAAYKALVDRITSARAGR